MSEPSSKAGRRVRAREVTRRRRTPKLDLTTSLAVLVPLLTIGLLALVRTPPAHDTTQPPSLTKLTDATLICPSSQPSSPTATVSTASGSSGQVSVGRDSATSQVTVKPRAGTSVPGSGALVVRGRDALAPGLLALRSGLQPVTAQSCTVPTSDQWFTGIGARADHDSFMELTNPDGGPAVAEITLMGHADFSTRRLRGLTIPGHKTVTLDLGAVVPRRTLLSAQVLVTRGRLGVAVLDGSTNLATHRTLREWMPRQLAPAKDNQLLGLPTGPGARTLQLANPGVDVVRAQLKIVTADTSFTPAGLQPITLPPGATLKVPVSGVLDKALKDGAVGVEVQASEPVTASLLTELPGDRALTVPDDTIRHEAATLLPVATGPRSQGQQPQAPLQLSADSAGSARVTAYDASGTQLLSRSIGTQQGRTTAVALPRGTAFLQVVPQRTTVRGAVVVTGNGASVVPLTELLTQGLVPQISPGQN